MSAPTGDIQERLLAGQVVSTGPVIAASRYKTWHLYERLSAELEVSSTNAVAGDTLTVKLETGADDVHWDATPVLTFTAVLGNQAEPTYEKKSVARATPGEGWGSRLRAVATPVGATANFAIARLTLTAS
jgi:hypothetical protein